MQKFPVKHELTESNITYKITHMYHNQEIYPEDAKMIQHRQTDNHNVSYQQKDRKKFHPVISTDAEKAYNKIQYSFTIKLSKNRGRQNIPQYNNDSKCQPIANIN